MTREEIKSQCESVQLQINKICPEIRKYIIETVKRLLGGRDATCLDFREWGYETGGTDGCCIAGYDNKGPVGDGPALSITILTDDKGKETASVEVSAEYCNTEMPINNLTFAELKDMISVLDSLEEDLTAEDPEWVIDSEGEVIYKDNEE